MALTALRNSRMARAYSPLLLSAFPFARKASSFSMGDFVQAVVARPMGKITARDINTIFQRREHGIGGLQFYEDEDIVQFRRQNPQVFVGKSGQGEGRNEVQGRWISNGPERRTTAENYALWNFLRSRPLRPRNAVPSRRMPAGSGTLAVVNVNCSGLLLVPSYRIVKDSPTPA